jgi:tyrosine-protein kinase Etk/Wzc
MFAQEKESHLVDYLNVFLRRWKISLLVALLVFVGVTVYTFLQPTIYSAVATVKVHKKTSEDVMAQQIQLGGVDEMAAQIELFNSRKLAETVVQRLNLDWQIENDEDDLQVHIDKLDIDRKLSRVTVELLPNQRLRFYGEQNQLLGDAANGEPFASEGVHVQLRVEQNQPGARFTLQRTSMDAAVARVKANISVRESAKGTNLLVITYEDRDPEKASTIANAIADIFYERNIARKNAEANKMLSFVDQQLQTLGAELDLSEEELQSYKITTGLKRLSTEGSGLVEGAVTLEKERAALVLDRKQIEFFVNSPATNGFDFTAVEDVPGVPEAASKMMTLRAEYNDLLKDFTEAHPAVVAVSDQIRQLRSSILANCRLAIKRIDQKIGEIDDALAESEKKLENVPQEELELARMTRRNIVNADLYTYLLQRQQETRIAEASSTSNIEIIDRALTPKTPVRPNKKKALALGVILGLMLGVGLAFLLDYMDQTIKTSDDVKEKLGLNVFGIIPRIPFADEDAKLPGKRLVTTLAPKSPVVESFRALRTNLNFITAKQKNKVIMVTSSLPSEGKSTVSGNLAVVLSQTGAKVLLVGCDLRRPSLYEMFGQKNVPGLVDLLVDQNQNSLRKIVSPRLDFLSAGTVPPNPAEMLDSARFRKFIDMARERYDYVVLDAPPVLPVTDAQIIAPLVDINLVVLEPCRVPETAAQQMVESLRAVDAKIAGVILNDKSGRGFKYYGNYSYYGNKYYRGYYGETEDEVKEGAVVKGLKKVWGALNS